MALIKKFRIKKFKEKQILLELNKISMFYNKRQILNNLNLKINKQEVLGMLGPNGVGKSTIFHIITGLKDPSFGKVFINGESEAGKSQFPVGIFPNFDLNHLSKRILLNVESTINVLFMIKRVY